MNKQFIKTFFCLLSFLLCRQVTMAQAPVADFTTADTTICMYQFISFTDMSSNNPTSWQWFFQGADVPYSTDQHPQFISYSAPGSFEVRLIATNANGSDTLTRSNYITVSPSPFFLIYCTPDTLFCSGSGMDTNPSTYISYQWYINNFTPIPGATDSFLVIDTLTDYGLTVMNNYGCYNTVLFIPAGACVTGLGNDLSDDHAFSIYPNPVRDELKISGRWKSEKSTLSIFNLFGEKLYQQKITGAIAPTINISNLSPGFYLVELRSKNRRWSGKFNKE